MLVVAFVLATLGSTPSPVHAVSSPSVSRQDGLAGWLCLFDGTATFGWRGATLREGVLMGGCTVVSFADCEVRLDAARAGVLAVGDKSWTVREGEQTIRLADTIGPLRLADGLAIRRLQLLPLSMERVFDGKTLAGWHVAGPANTQQAWKVEAGRLRGQGNTRLESTTRLARFLLQMDVHRVRDGAGTAALSVLAQRHAEHSGINIPLAGSEVAIGSLHGLQPARPAPPPGDTYRLTVLVDDQQAATWLNGQWLVAWGDCLTHGDGTATLPGCTGDRPDPSPIALQVDGPGTAVEFQNIRVQILR